MVITNPVDAGNRDGLETARPRGGVGWVEFPEGNRPLTGCEPGSAQQVGALVAFLASEEATHVSGIEVWIDGAQSLLQG